MDWRERDGVRWLEAEFDGARAAFSTRLGGVSDGSFASLNIGMQTGDDADAVARNRRRLGDALGRGQDGILFGHQVHGATLARSESRPTPNPFLAGERPDEADGQATANPTLTPLVQVADCLPVAVSGPAGVAMLHCGWRGVAGGIVERGAAEVSATSAAVGPGIGPCCYEVGEDVLEQFARFGPGVARGRMLDLAEAVRRALAEAGVGRVETVDLCTSCEPELFFSHRRDRGVTGRQAGLAWLEDDDG